MRFELFGFTFLFFLSFSTMMSAQTNTPPAAPLTPIESLSKKVDGIEKKLTDVLSIEQRIGDKYADQLGGLQQREQALNWFLYTVSGFGFVVLGGAAIASWRFGKSQSEFRDRQDQRFDDQRTEINDTLNQRIESFLDQLVRGANKDGNDLEELKNIASSTVDELDEITSDMKGFRALLDVGETAVQFDPLIGYFSVDREIDKRETLTKQMLRGDDSIDVADTIRDESFRQKVAVIFKRLLEEIERDEEAGDHRFDSSTCYNIAANASKMEMDFVALKFMKHASKRSKQSNPEIEARLIRQRFSMHEITADEAISALSKPLADVSAQDIHLVVAEAFNIGLRSGNPVGVAEVTIRDTKEELSDVSYISLNAGRMYLFGGTSKDWARGRELIEKGINSLEKEPASVRWYTHSWQELAQVLLSDPSWLDEFDGKLRRMLSGAKDIRNFVTRYGDPVAQALHQLGVLHEFIVSDGAGGEGGSNEAAKMAFLQQMLEQAAAAGSDDAEPEVRPG